MGRYTFTKERVMQETISMSNKELNTLKIIEKIIDQRLSLSKGAKSLGITPRHLRRLKRAYLTEGVSALLSKQRGKTNHRHDTKLKDAVLSLIRQYYADYGPTLISEKLAEHHQLYVSRESVRQWMHEAGIRSVVPVTTIKMYQPRHRRERLGELIQMDGSIHDWFEGRAEKCTLLVLIDDATSELVGLRFAKAETTFDYFDVVRDYLEAHGKPKAFYVDKHGVFSVNHKEAQSGDGFTQFGRALETLGVELIHANSPQAKGRVERVNRTLQDRLIKELRYHCISTMEQANEFLKSYIHQFNKRFAKRPKSPENAHVALSDSETGSLNRLFSIQLPRTISKHLTVSYKKTILLIKNQKHPRRLVGKKIMVSERSNGPLILYDGDKPLEYEVLKNYDFQERVMGIREMHTFLNQRLTNQPIIMNKSSGFILNANITSGHF